MVIGWGLVVIGVWYAIDVLRGDTGAPSADSEDADPSLPADWKVLGGLAAALAVYAVLMDTAGFMIASAVLFWGAAFAMGSRSFVRDAAIGLLVSLVTFLVFSEWLGIRLPVGVLEQFLG
jgi:putative tricarboxylic transport membrane protein